MISRKITEDIAICLTAPEFAEALFQLTNENRSFLRRWLPWLDMVTEVAHTESFISGQMELFENDEALHICIFNKGELAGVAAFNQINLKTKTGQIGYWLGQKFNGKGIMTTVVKELMHIGQTRYDLKRVEIRCATENLQSRAIPERLGFKHQCTIKHAEQVYDHCYNHEVYVKQLTGK